MDLVRDMLDKEVMDRHGREMGRADSVVLEIRQGAPPRVVAIDVGPSVLLARVAMFLGRWVTGLEHALGIAEGRPVRIPFEEILDQELEKEDHIKVDLAAGETAAAALESRARTWFSGIPGGS